MMSHNKKGAAASTVQSPQQAFRSPDELSLRLSNESYDRSNTRISVEIVYL